MEAYDKVIYRGYLIKEDLHAAIAYIKQFPEKKELYEKYQSLFEKEEYLTYDIEKILNEILLLYQKYYRDVLYLKIPAQEAEHTLLERLKVLLSVKDTDITMEKLEEKDVAQAFTQRGYYFQGGQTGRFYGPYIWKKTEIQTYDVELPDGMQKYSVRFLDDFISRSWLDYISFSDVGTGGWADENGMINCVKSSYDLDSESFRVSLLKHEAQHTMDHQKYADLTTAELEYRAKLVELIYSEKRNLLKSFLSEADPSQKDNGHAVASEWIAGGFESKTGCSRAQLEELPVAQIQTVAAKLFQESNKELQKKQKADY